PVLQSLKFTKHFQSKILATMHTNGKILLYVPHKNAGRIKFMIPYEMKEERLSFKALNGSYYHPNQRLWSLPNTAAHKKKVRALFGSKLRETTLAPPPEMPTAVLTDHSRAELERHYQKMTLK